MIDKKYNNERAYRKTGTRDPTKTKKPGPYKNQRTGTLAGPYKNRETGTLKKQELFIKAFLLRYPK